MRFELRWLVVLTLLLLCACDEVVPTTQMLIVVNLDETLRARADSIELVTDDERSELELAGVTVPFSFSLVPVRGELEGELELRVRDGAELLVSRRLSVAFRKYRTMSYGVLLSAACTGIECGDDDTCMGCGRCGPALVPLESYEPLARARDAVARWRERLVCDADDPDA